MHEPVCGWISRGFDKMSELTDLATVFGWSNLLFSAWFESFLALCEKIVWSLRDFSWKDCIIVWDIGGCLLEKIWKDQV